MPEPPTPRQMGRTSEPRGGGGSNGPNTHAGQVERSKALPGPHRTPATPADTSHRPAQPSGPADPEEAREGTLFPVLPPTNGHQFKWIRHRWACQKCLRRTRRDPPFLAFPCAGHNAVLSELVRDRRGHALFVTSTPDGILFVCMKCGCISEGVRISNLSERCNTRPASAHTRANLNRIRNGQHPSHNRGDAQVLEELVPIDDFL